MKTVACKGKPDRSIVLEKEKVAPTDHVQPSTPTPVIALDILKTDVTYIRWQNWFVEASPIPGGNCNWSCPMYMAVHTTSRVLLADT